MSDEFYLIENKQKLSMDLKHYYVPEILFKTYSSIGVCVQWQGGGDGREEEKERDLPEREINIIFHEIFLHSHILMFLCLEKKRDTQKQENVVLMVKDPEWKSVP